MSNIEVRPQPIPADLVEKVVIGGDLAKLSANERMSYYNRVCESLGLNPLTQPFAYIQLNGKLTLYAKKDATDQLRKLYGISILITDRLKTDDLIVVTARAKMFGGREDESTGAVNISGLKGDALANAMMKAETKAKRRATLSICGLGMLDEHELETIKEAKPIHEQTVLDRVLAPVEKPAPQPPPTSPGDYVVRIGKKYVGQAIKDIHHEDLVSFLGWLHDKADAKFRETADAQDFIRYAEEYIAETMSDLDVALASKLEDDRS
jgi:hypothetical protein